MDWFKQLRKLEITQEERNRALIDALGTQNPLLIQMTLAMGADPMEGGGQVLVYASEQGDLDLVKKLIPIINPGSDADKEHLEEATIKATLKGHKQILKEIFAVSGQYLSTAIKAAVDNELRQMARWLLHKGAVLYIDRDCIRRHLEIVKDLVSNNSEATTDIEEEALFEIISIENSAEVLEMLLKAVKRDTPENFNKWLVSLAEECVETDRVDCMEIIIKFGVDIKSVSTRYCRAGAMRKFMEENGAHMWEY